MERCFPLSLFPKEHIAPTIHVAYSCYKPSIVATKSWKNKMKNRKGELGTKPDCRALAKHVWNLGFELLTPGMRSRRGGGGKREHRRKVYLVHGKFSIHNSSVHHGGNLWQKAHLMLSGKRRERLRGSNMSTKGTSPNTSLPKPESTSFLRFYHFPLKHLSNYSYWRSVKVTSDTPFSLLV